MKRSVSIFCILLIASLSFSSCEKDEDTQPKETTTTTSTTPTTPGGDGNNGGSGDTNSVPTNTEILAKRWIVSEAYVNTNTPDNSSRGLTFDVRSDGSYTLSTGYVGTWQFESNETKINWDKGTQFNQVFTLIDFKENRIEATFVSAFTNQNARWVMTPL